MKAIAISIMLLISSFTYSQFSFITAAGVGTKVREEAESPLAIFSFAGEYRQKIGQSENFGWQAGAGFFSRASATEGTAAGFISGGLNFYGVHASLGFAYGGGQVKQDRYVNGTDTVWLTKGAKSTQFTSFLVDFKYVLNEKRWDLNPFTGVSWLNKDILFTVGLKYQFR